MFHFPFFLFHIHIPVPVSSKPSLYCCFTTMALSSRLTSILPLSFHLIPAISCSRAVHTFPSTSQPPPIAKKVPFTLSAHGLTWQDPYYWMRNTNDPDFIDYLNQENSYAQAFMADTENLRRTLFSQMKNRMPARISTPPERWGPWFVRFIPTPFHAFSWFPCLFIFVTSFFFGGVNGECYCSSYGKQHHISSSNIERCNW